MPKFKKVVRRDGGGPTGSISDPNENLRDWLAYKEAEQGLVSESEQFLPLNRLLPLGRLLPGSGRASKMLPGGTGSVRFGTDAGSRALGAGAGAGAKMLESGRLLPSAGQTGSALTRTGADIARSTPSALAKARTEAAKSTSPASEAGSSYIKNLLKSVGAGTGILGMTLSSNEEDADQEAMRNALASKVASSRPTAPILSAKSKETAAQAQAKPKEATRGSGVSSKKSPDLSVDQDKMNAMLMAAAKPGSDISDLIASSSKSTVPSETAVGMENPLAGLPGAPKKEFSGYSKYDYMTQPSGESSIASQIPKTKSGMKKFIQDYGKYIALGAIASQGGKAGKIAAPIIAALPGLIQLMKAKGKKGKTEAPTQDNSDFYKKGGVVKKSSGGAIRKFKGGSMNTKDSMLTPKYKKGGATGEMPQHKKMAMGKPTPQSTGQKFAKGGTMKCATGGVTKGYGISKKIKPSGPMC